MFFEKKSTLFLPLKTWKDHPQYLVMSSPDTFFFSTANRPKSSPNLNFCSIKISHRRTSLYWLCSQLSSRRERWIAIDHPCWRTKQQNTKASLRPWVSICRHLSGGSGSHVRFFVVIWGTTFFTRMNCCFVCLLTTGTFTNNVTIIKLEIRMMSTVYPQIVSDLNTFRPWIVTSLE